MNLNEGLRPNDLRGMVKNIISVDEYQSKIDERAIVLAFYVSERQAAEDLNRFIQKSHVELLDSEVSAAPDQKGNYMVFVEMAMNDKTAKAAADICADINAIAEISKWVVNVRGCEPSSAVEAAAVEKVIRSTLHFSLKEFFDASDLKQVNLVEGLWYASNGVSSGMMFSVHDYGSFDQVVARNKLTESAIDMSNDALRVSKHLRSMLGGTWSVERVGAHYAAYREGSDALLLLTYKHL